MRIATHVGLPTESRLRLAKQAGVTDIVTGPPGGWRTAQEGGLIPGVEAWSSMRKQVESAGLVLSVVESIPVSDRVMLGLAGRDADIESFGQAITDMGAAGIPILCYNWMPVIHVVRTSRTTRVRGGAMATSYDHSLMENALLTEVGVVTDQQLWESLEYFLRAIVPIAEEANVQLAMHPDDPPLSPIRGIDRIMINVDNFQSMIDLVPSPNNGITFCQGCFAEMGVDIPQAIHHFGQQNRIFFAHFRNIIGAVPAFCETFHDAGDTDMFAAMEAYYEVGFEGPMRPDHFPVMGDEEPFSGTPSLLGRLYALGYMKGLIEGIEKTRA